MFIKISHNRLKNCQNVAKMLCGTPKTRHFSAFLSHFSKIIFEKRLIRQSQRCALCPGVLCRGTGGRAETRCRTGKNLKPRKMPDREACGAYPPVHCITLALGQCHYSPRSAASGRVIPVFVRDAVLGAFCLSQFTHKRTLPRNANQMKNTTKPNLFSCQRDHQGFHIRHEYPHPPSARLVLNWSGRTISSFLWRQILLSILFCHEDGKFNNHPASEVVIKWNFRAAMLPLPWLKKH